MDSFLGNMAHWHDSATATPIKFELTRYAMIHAGSKWQSASGFPVCRMWVRVNMLQCAQSAQVNGYDTQTRLKCKCRGGIVGRVVQTGQLSVAATDTKHKRRIQDAECRKWFVVMDGLVRVELSLLQAFGYMSQDGHCFVDNDDHSADDQTA